MSRLTKKCGTVVQLCAVRSAMMRPRELGTSRLPYVFAVATELEGDEAAACTSDARISPPGPEACTVVRLTPNSFASRRALGEIFALEVSARREPLDCVAATCDVSDLARDPDRVPGAADPFSIGGASPGATIHAMVCPTGISAPAAALIPAKIPSAGA